MKLKRQRRKYAYREERVLPNAFIALAPWAVGSLGLASVEMGEAADAATGASKHATCC
jgi:hypothetical protein